MTKYLTNRNFRAEEFAELLNSKGIKAYAVGHDVVLDREAYNAFPKAQMPLWMWQNLEYINNPYCTEEVEG